MKLFLDIFTGDELCSDSYPMKLVDDVYYEVEGKNISESNDIDDSFIGVQVTLEQAQTEDPSRTSLIIAHRLSTIRSCDLIYVLEMGRIVESGTHTELVQKGGIYYTMLNTQNNGH
ncbi:unnamed protein product [Adineta steineri]|uniref:TCTP domain-containing protein n=1 Tax=Adineta steineri TaxID=433720 RepID=A0A814NVI3_9BILA|nr:unnamed protein product [Adineta steineri]